MTENQKDIELLHTDPGELIVRYQASISAIVQKRLINTGFYPFQEKDDLIQEVSVRLLAETGKMQKQYNKEKAQFITFISLKIVNICYQILRKEKNKPETISIEDKPHILATDKHETDKETYLIDEYNKYEAILKMFYRKRAKIELCLQLIYRIPVFINYFIAYCKKAAKSFYKAATIHLPIDRDYTDKDVYRVITPYLNECDQKNNTEGAAQRWLNNIIDQLTELMNTGHEENVYDKETFQVLVEKYYQFKKERKIFPALLL